MSAVLTNPPSAPMQESPGLWTLAWRRLRQDMVGMVSLVVVLFFLDEINQDYVRTARAKGVPEKTVMMKHVLRNAMIPILTNIGIALPGIFVGSFLLEVFFSIPGLGREIITAVNRSDFPVIKAVTVYLAILTMLINLLVDVMYKYVDPRVSFK